MGLEKILEKKPSGKSLIHDLKKIESKAEPLLSRIAQTFSEYTEHDMKHSRRVIENLNLSIPDSLKESFNEYEICFPIASAYLHDIGTVNFPDLVKEPGQRGADIQTNGDYIRENHHLMSEEFVTRNYEDLAIGDQHQARIIGARSWNL